MIEKDLRFALLIISELYHLAPEVGAAPQSQNQLERFLNPRSLRLIINKLDKKTASSFAAWNSRDRLECEDRELRRHQIVPIAWYDPDYPTVLKEIPLPPPVIYMRGRMTRGYPLSLGVVGSRRPTPYGIKTVQTLIPPIARSGLEIISGLAIGIDTAAHLAALENDGNTAAVLGSGLASIYPQENLGLAEKIVSSGGALISEFPPLTGPRPENFPRRNRLISGLSRSILVIEAARRSGALITSRLALEQGRDVLAVPGNIFSPLSEGTNRLIQQGAYPITKPTDIIDHFLSLT